MLREYLYCTGKSLSLFWSAKYLTSPTTTRSSHSITNQSETNFSQFGILTLAFLLFSISLAHAQTWTVDLEGDGRKERIIFRPKKQGAIAVWREGKKVWQGVPARWQAWKLKIADVDGDGKSEFVLGVRIKARYFRHLHKSIFILGWNGKYAYARWLGSHMSKPLVDFTTAELDGEPGDELVSLEITRDSKRCLVVYKWCGFGFAGLWQSQAFADAKLVRVGRRIGIKLPNGQSQFLSHQDGSFALTEDNPKLSNFVGTPLFIQRLKRAALRRG